MIKKSLTNNIFNKMNLNKFICEMCGTFLLVFVGTSAAVFSGNFLGTALAFGFSLTLAAYTVSRNTGCHINPAVSLAMVCNKKIGWTDFLWYVLGQLVGALIASFFVLVIAYWGLKTQMNLVSLGQNSTDMLGLGFSFLTELITSFIFILVIIISTSSKDLNKFAGLIIGATLFLIHLTTMNLTGTSVNPARSLAPALLMIPFDTSAITQVWVFILAPLTASILAFLASKYFLNFKK